MCTPAGADISGVTSFVAHSYQARRVQAFLSRHKCPVLACSMDCVCMISTRYPSSSRFVVNSARNSWRSCSFPQPDLHISFCAYVSLHTFINRLTLAQHHRACIREIHNYHMCWHASNVQCNILRMLLRHSNCSPKYCAGVRNVCLRLYGVAQHILSETNNVTYLEKWHTCHQPSYELSPYSQAREMELRRLKFC